MVYDAFFVACTRTAMEYMYYDADYGDVFVVCIRGNAKDYTIFSADVKSGPMLSGM